MLVIDCMRAKSLQLCPTLCDTLDHSLLGSSVHGILQARILEWVAMSSSRDPGDLPDPEIEPTSLMSPALAGRYFTTSTIWEVSSEGYHLTSSCPHSTPPVSRPPHRPVTRSMPPPLRHQSSTLLPSPQLLSAQLSYLPEDPTPRACSH